MTPCKAALEQTVWMAAVAMILWSGGAGADSTGWWCLEWIRQTMAHRLLGVTANLFTGSGTTGDATGDTLSQY